MMPDVLWVAASVLRFRNKKFVSVVVSFVNWKNILMCQMKALIYVCLLVNGPVSDFSYPTRLKHVFQAYSSLKNDNELSIAKADRSICVVNLNKEDNDVKINTLLSN